MSQLSSGLVQMRPHVPLLQVRVPPAPEGHAIVQLPQCETSLSRSISQPFTAKLSQLPNPELQVTPHMPFEHAAVEFGRVGQKLLQKPQWTGLVRVSVSQPLPESPSQS